MLNWVVMAVWVALALYGLSFVVVFLDELRGRRLNTAPRLTIVLLWYFTLSWPFTEPEFNKLHWFWLLPMAFFLPYIIQNLRRRWALFAANSSVLSFLGFLAGPWKNPPQFWFSTIVGSLLIYTMTLRALPLHPIRPALHLVGGALAAGLAIRLFDRGAIRLPPHTKENCSIIRRRLSWMDRMRFGTAGEEVAAELKPDERLLAVAKGRFSVRTTHS